MIYDIFYISKGSINDVDWNNFKTRFPTSQKIENVKEFEDVRSRSFTKFFYVVWDGTKVLDFDFDYRVNEYDTEYIHVWKTLRYDEETYQGGIALFPKNVDLVSSREFAHRFYIKKKEIDIVNSKQVYPVYTIDDYNQYLDIIENTSHEMFWNVPSDIDVCDDSVFDIYFDPNNGKYDYDRNENHVFLNNKFYDGVCLFSKNKVISKKEFKFRFIINRKEWDIKVSEPRPYDIFFISYNEPNADINYNRLKERFPRAKRIQGVKGIHNAHIEAAKQSTTEKFWVVDADAKIVDKFNFESEYFPHYDSGNRKEYVSTVQVWHSSNPINDLVYGYGGVKLLPKFLTENMEIASVDMTTSISDRFKVMPQVSNITEFNVSEFDTWRSAFRECTKLASKIIDNNYDEETDIRLGIWCTIGKDKPYGRYAIGGATEGRLYGYESIGNTEALSKINDFEWLKQRFEIWQKNNEQ